MKTPNILDIIYASVMITVRWTISFFYTEIQPSEDVWKKPNN